MIYDAAIIGAGCAGLQLAVALRRHCPDLKVVLLDARPEYANDRTWSFWHPSAATAAPLFWEAAISHRWPAWQVSAAARTVRREAPGLDYVSLRADAFYAATRAALTVPGGPVWQLETPVSRVEETAGPVVLHTPSGPVSAHYVFDSRPPPESPPGSGTSPAFQQVFTGLHLRTRRPCWSPDTARLMDFQPTEDGTIAFVYTLPNSANTALVEVTWLVPAGAGQRPDISHVTAFLASAHGLGPDDFTILGTESGSIPMDPQLRSLPSGSARCFDIGTRSGAVRASTGYGFLAMSRHAEKIARTWQETGRPAFIPHRSRAWTALDTIFLAALHRAPQQAPAWFIDLFEKTHPALLVRFLQQEARPGEILSLMRSLPPAPFLRAAFRQLPALLRR
jgi:lycopene beta-cyclase